jgi:DNA-binding response OmpR family regulator
MGTNVLILHSDHTSTEQVLSDFKNYVFQPTMVTTLDDALSLVQRNHYDLIVVEAEPSMRYADKPIAKLRAITQSPILALMRGGSMDDFCSCLTVAHECVWEPFRPAEIVARATELMDRYAAQQAVQPQQNHIDSHDLVIQPVSHKVSVGNAPVHLTPKEYAILLYLAQNREQLLSHEQIYIQVWHEDVLYNIGNVVCRQICSIRRKLAQLSRERYIETVWGSGYRFCG